MFNLKNLCIFIISVALGFSGLSLYWSLPLLVAIITYGFLNYQDGVNDAISVLKDSLVNSKNDNKEVK